VPGVSAELAGFAGGVSFGAGALTTIAEAVGAVGGVAEPSGPGAASAVVEAVAAAGGADADATLSEPCDVVASDGGACGSAGVWTRGAERTNAWYADGGDRRIAGAGARGKSLTLAVAMSGFDGIGVSAVGAFGLPFATAAATRGGAAAPAGGCKVAAVARLGDSSIRVPSSTPAPTRMPDRAIPQTMRT